MSIASFIKNDLAARLRAADGVPVPLTLDSLAEHYNVSFTPVRTAVSELIREGLLEKGANRRLTVSASTTRQTRDQTSAPPVQPADPFDVISQDLVQQSLTGDPVYLREEATAEKYGISRSAIRNILHRLAGEGILDHIPRRGWRLRPFRHDDLQAFIEVREVLELKALDLAQPHLRSDRLEQMLTANSLPHRSTDTPQIDESLHDYLITSAGNAYIQDFFDRQGRYYRLLFGWEDHDRQAAIDTVRQHRAILEALLNQDWQTARRELSHHILNNHPILSRIIDRRSAQQNSTEPEQAT